MVCALFPACLDKANDVSLYIAGHVAPDDQCILTPENNFVLSPGRLDLSFPQVTYTLRPLFSSQIVTRGATGMADPNVVVVEGATVRILDADSNPLYGEDDQGYVAEGTTVVPSATGSGPGRSVGSLLIIPPSVSADLLNRVGRQGLIYASVKPFGHTLGDVSLDADAFLWPIRLCSGCLRACIDATSSGEKICDLGQDFSAAIDDCS